MSLSLRMTNFVDQMLSVPQKGHSQSRPLFLVVLRLLI